MLEGRARTLSGPSPAVSSARAVVPSGRLAVLVWAYRYRGLLPGRPGVLEDAGGPLGRVVGDAAQAAGLLARGVCPHGGLAPLTQELSHLAGQCVVFPPGAFSFSLLRGFFALQGGLAAFDGLPAPGQPGPGPVPGFPRMFRPVCHRLARGTRQVVQPGVALVGGPFPLISVPLPPVSDLLALVSVSLPPVSDLLALVSVPSELAGHRVVFPPGACSLSLLPGFSAPQGGLAADDGLPAPGQPGLGPVPGFPGAFLQVCHRQARRPRQVVQLGVALVGGPFPLVSVSLPPVSDLLALVSDLLAPVGIPLAPVGPVVLRGTGTGPRVMLAELHPSRMRLSQWPSRCLGLARPVAMRPQADEAPAHAVRAATSAAADITADDPGPAAGPMSRADQ